MRKLVAALGLAILAATGAGAAAPAPVSAAAYQAKVVIVVGATQGTTSAYRVDADAIAAEFSRYTSNVVKVYSPNATWSAVSKAAAGANVLVYLGHGSGYPNPYLSYEKPNGDNGMGLNASAAGSDNNTVYYGESYMAQLGLAPNAVVLLNHLCYASGNSEPGGALPTLGVAEQRVEGYASGFIRAGAKAVLADAMNNVNYFIDGLFTAHTTIDAMWKANPYFNHHLTAWASGRNIGYTAEIDPNLDNPAPDGDVYYRSMVSIPTLKTDDVVSGQITSWAPQTGFYYPVVPTRVVDTRGNGVGPVGSLISGGRYAFQISGNGGVPSGAIAITANLTVTGQNGGGWLYLGPTISSKPVSSTINFPVGDNRANGVTVPLSPQGTVSAWFGGNSAGSTTNMIIDVTGYYMAGDAGSGSGYVSYSPQRILDTRSAIGLKGKFYSQTPRAIQVAGVAGLPATGMVAVVGNVTVVRPTGRGYVSVGPTLSSPPVSSTVNFPAGDIRANNFVVPIAPDGTISAVYWTDPGQSTDLVVDISGYYTAGAGAAYHSLDPARILDTRVPMGLAGPIPALTAQTLQVIGNGGVVPGAIAIAANVTVTQQSQGGYIAVGPSVSPPTPFSNLNFPVGDNRANGVVVPLTGDGELQFLYGASAGQSTQLILDVGGYFK
jgi:hypothetical protein